jgi:predicted ATPase/DNA-binding CsgD family transcriptional regulator
MTTIEKRPAAVTPHGMESRWISYNAPMTGRDDRDLPLAKPLTPREREILDCLGHAMSNRQIAEHLTVSLNTVKWYVRQIYNKLGVNNREEAVGRARRLELLPEVEWEATVRHNLPVAATPFVGRERELTVLSKLITDPHVRSITIFGMGGIGKTRLALEAAKRQVDPEEIGDDGQQKLSFPDGIFFVSLAPVNSPTEIVATLAAALSFHFQDAGQSKRSETQQILDYLKHKRMLLVMDNFEHILDGRTLLTEISGQAAGIKLLLTSRERLQLLGEQLFPLQGLEMPPTGVSEEESLADYAAAQLFLNISRRTLPDFQILEGDAEQILRICRLVEGMPLGLELAASWVGLLPLSEIASEIEMSLALLASKRYDVSQRHQSMQATLDVSWKRLSAEQKLTFQELTVFRGGFTRAAAMEVAGATLPLLVTLVNKSWLSYDRQNDRYNIHELLRQYGAGKLRTDTAHKLEVQCKHSAYFCGFLNEREAAWFGPRQLAVASALQGEIENIRVAWRHAAKESDHGLLAQGLNSLCRFYLWEGRITDGRNACRLADAGLSKPLAEQRADDPENMALRSQVLVRESEFVNEGAQKEELLSKSQKLLDRAVLTGWDTRAEQALIFLQKANAAGVRDYEEALQIAAQSRELFRELGDRWGEAEVLFLMGNRYTFQGAFDRARESLLDSLEIRRQLGDAFGIADTTIQLGLVAQHQGKYEEAETLHMQGLSLFKQLQNRRHEGFGLAVLSFTHSWAGKFSVARDAATLSLELTRDIGDHHVLWNLIALITALIHLGRNDETKAMAAESLELARQSGRSTEKGYALMYLGNIALIEGENVQAVDYLEESAMLMAGLRYVYQALPQANLCYAVRAIGRDKSARIHLEDALRSGIEIHSMTPIMYCLPVAALLAADNGRFERAIELYSLAQRFGHIKNSRWFEDVAGRELDGVGAALSPEVASAAEARGRELDPWQTADELLEEYTTTMSQ